MYCNCSANGVDNTDTAERRTKRYRERNMVVKSRRSRNWEGMENKNSAFRSAFMSAEVEFSEPQGHFLEMEVENKLTSQLGSTERQDANSRDVK